MAWNNVLCMYYSRTGNTKTAMEEIAKALDAECSAAARGFLKQHGKELRNASYVITRGSEDKNEEVFQQMDLYTPCGHRTAVSLRSGSVGYAFWQEEFLRQTQEFLKERQW